MFKSLGKNNGIINLFVEYSDRWGGLCLIIIPLARLGENGEGIIGTYNVSKVLVKYMKKYNRNSKGMKN